MKFVLVLLFVSFAAITAGQQFGLGQQPLVVGPQVQQQYPSNIQYLQPAAQQPQSLGYYWPYPPRPQPSRGLDRRMLFFLLYFLSQRRAPTAAPPVTVPTVAATTDKCFGYRPYLSCCYKYYAMVVTWNKAKEECEKVGAQLANVGVRTDANRREIFASLGITSQLAWLGATAVSGNAADPVWMGTTTTVAAAADNNFKADPPTQAQCGLFHLSHDTTTYSGIAFDLCNTVTNNFVCEKC